MVGTHRRCTICNKTDTHAIATFPEEYHPGLRFTEYQGDFICIECDGSIRDSIADFGDDEHVAYEDD